jgi:hypothetical protein
MPLSIIMPPPPRAHVFLPSSFFLHLSFPPWPSPQLAVQQGLSQDMASTHEDARGVNTKRTSAGTWLETLQWVPREDMGGWKVRATLIYSVRWRDSHVHRHSCMTFFHGTMGGPWVTLRLATCDLSPDTRTLE